MKEQIEKFINRLRRAFSQEGPGEGGGDFARSRDWFLLLLGAMVASFVLMGVGGYTYVTTTAVRSESSGVNTSASNTIRQKEQLDVVLEKFRKRAESFEELRNTPEDAPSPGGVWNTVNYRVSDDVPEVVSDEVVVPTTVLP